MHNRSGQLRRKFGFGVLKVTLKYERGVLVTGAGDESFNGWYVQKKIDEDEPPKDWTAATEGLDYQGRSNQYLRRRDERDAEDESAGSDTQWYEQKDGGALLYLGRRWCGGMLWGIRQDGYDVYIRLYENSKHRSAYEVQRMHGNNPPATGWEARYEGMDPAPTFATLEAVKQYL